MKFLGLVSSLAILIVILSPSIAAPAHRMLPVKRDLAVHVCQTKYVMSIKHQVIRIVNDFRLLAHVVHA